MSEHNTSLLADLTETPEELLGPPQVDMLGVCMMMLLSIIVGWFISVAVLVAAFFSVGKFSIASGVSPLILAFTTFFAVSLASGIYILLAKSVFPNLYTRNVTALKHTIVYMIVLYICMIPIYVTVSTSTFESSAVLLSYLIHVLLAIFGIELILGVVSQYRYVLLSLYANIVAVILTGGVVFWIFQKFSQSGTSLFILMGLSVMMFFLSTTLIFLVKFLYYKYYTTTGHDPLGALFYGIEEEEKQKVDAAKHTLLQ